MTTTPEALYLGNLACRIKKAASARDLALSSPR